VAINWNWSAKIKKHTQEGYLSTPQKQPLSGLIADIGGTNARFGFVENAHTRAYSHELILPTQDFASFQDTVEHYLQWLKHRKDTFEISHALFAIAAPLAKSCIKLTNCPWVIQPQAVQDALNIPNINFINDFAAQAMAIAWLGEQDLMPLHCPRSIDNLSQQQLSNTTQGVKGIIGPGTGLGIAYSTEKWAIHATEGGHVTLPCVNQQERDLYAFLEQQFGHVSAERVCSGPGLENIYKFLFPNNTPLSAAVIGTQAVAVNDTGLQQEQARQVVNLMLACLGSVAGNLALSLNAEKIYITGGVANKLKPLIQNSLFIERFLNKGRFKTLLELVPVDLITHPNPGFLGLAQHVFLMNTP